MRFSTHCCHNVWAFWVTCCIVLRSLTKMMTNKRHTYCSNLALIYAFVTYVELSMRRRYKCIVCVICSFSCGLCTAFVSCWFRFHRLLRLLQTILCLSMMDSNDCLFPRQNWSSCCFKRSEHNTVLKEAVGRNVESTININLPFCLCASLNLHGLLQPILHN